MSGQSITSQYFRSDFKRWIRWIALAVLFAIACGFLANWQFNRRAQVVQVINRIDRNYTHTVSKLPELVPNPAGFSLKNEYRPVEVSGRYRLDLLTLVRNRAQDGRVGYEELIPFELSDGKLVVVSRGWIASSETSAAPAAVPLPPATTPALVGRLIHTEHADGRSAPEGQVMSITPSVLAEKWGVPLESLYLGAYLELADDGTHSKDLVLPKRPDITEGNHLSYAFQWVLFALMAFVAIAINVRRDLDEKRAAEDASYVPKPKRKRVGDDDKAAEDALLDGLAE